MSDPKDNPKPLPPDDFGATTPNIRVPQDKQNAGASDWEKTNYNYDPKDLQQDDKWKKTAYNVPTPGNQDFNKTQMPGQRQDDWAATRANINLPEQPGQYEPSRRDERAPQQSDFGSTTPYINLPESEKAKYDNTPAVESLPVAKEAEAKDKAKKASMSWLWPVAALSAMLLFSIVVFAGVYFFFLNKSGYDVVIKSAPPRSTYFINGTVWGVSNGDGDTVLQGLKAGETKRIEIKGPNSVCRPIENVVGIDGKNQEFIAQCTTSGGDVCGPTCKKCENGKCMDGAGTATCDPSCKRCENGKCMDGACTTANCSGHCDLNGKCIPADDICQNVKVGDFATAAKCANDALDRLGETYTSKQLVDAMNLYIVNFDKNKFDIKNSDRAFLQKASLYIKRLKQLEPNTHIEVGGHTDSDGTDAKNMPLSVNRATAVHDTLIGFGVDKDMLEVRGYGATKPKEPNTTEAGKFHNRRIEYTAIVR